MRPCIYDQSSCDHAKGTRAKATHANLLSRAHFEKVSQYELECIKPPPISGREGRETKRKTYFTWATEKAIQILAALSTKEGETDGGTENDKQTGA